MKKLYPASAQFFVSHSCAKALMTAPLQILLRRLVMEVKGFHRAIARFFLTATAIFILAMQARAQTPAVTGYTIVCPGSTTTLTASGTAPFTWYNAASGGNLLYTGATFTTPALTANTTYWVSANGGTRLAVNINVPQTASYKAVATHQSICVGSSTALSVQPANTTISWYDASLGGNLLGTGNLTVSPQKTTVYYARFAQQVQPDTVTFNYTGGAQTFTVPAGVTSLQIDASGAAGGLGDQNPAYHAKGGRVQASMSVTPGQVLSIYVGSMGGDYSWSTLDTAYFTLNPGGYNGGGSTYIYYFDGGGGGGGATDIRINGQGLTNRVIVAGGGGGGAQGSTEPTYPGYATGGGAGGGLNGGNSVLISPYNGETAAQGGTQSSGGAPGCFDGICGLAGSLGQGGQGFPQNTGGGGGGYYGGGSGEVIGGGGGGSSYTDPTMFQNVVHTQGYNGGNGQLIITYNALSTCTVNFALADTVTVDPMLTATVSINATVCPSCGTTFTATVVNGGTTPTYAWYKNNIPVGTNAPTYSDNGLNAGDNVQCAVTNNAACLLNTPAVANIIVAPPAVTSFSPSWGPAGTLVTIQGSNITTLKHVYIGGVAAIPISNNGSQVVAMVMPGAATGSVSLTDLFGTGSGGGNFTFAAVAPPSLQQGGKLTGGATPGNNLYYGSGVAISADGNTAIIGISGDNSGAGGAVIYTRANGNWTQQGNELVGAGATGLAAQGNAVAISADGNTALVGGFSDNSSAGAAWVFVRSNGAWSQQGNKLTAADESGNAQLGYSVSLSADGNTAFMGGLGDNNNLGAGWIFNRLNGVWAQNGSKLVGTGAINTAEVYMGSSVAMSADGNTAVLGGKYDNARTGAIWVFTNNNGSWTQQGNKLLASDAISSPYGPELGCSVAVSADGNTIFSGGSRDNNFLGAAWVFTRSGGVWTQQGAKLLGAGIQNPNSSSIYFGDAVSLSADGNTAIVAATEDNNSTGAMWVFTRRSGIWSQQGNKLTGIGEVPFAGVQNFGQTVALSSDGVTALAGDRYDNTNMGAAWVFTAKPPPTLASLAPSAGTLSPVFATATTNYTETVASTTVSITVTPTTSDPTATVTVNGTAVTSGTPSGAIALTTGTNTITTIVTAQDGVTTNAYTITVTVNPPLPSISYAIPLTYIQGIAITALTPVSSNVATPGYSGSPVVLGTGFGSPTSVAADVAGNVYVADEGHKAVKMIPAGGGAPVTLGSGFSLPYGVAVDGAGNVYVADYSGNAVKEIPAGNGTPVALGSGFLNPTGVAVDAAGNMYVADYGNGAVKKIPFGGGAPVTLGSGFSHPAGVAVDGSGNVYVADAGNNTVKKIPVGGGAPVTLGSGFITPHGVAVDGSGNVFVADYGNNAVKEIPAGSGPPVVIGAGFSHPVGISADGAGNIDVADFGSNAVKQIKPVGGYYISPALPAGLSFANASGTISGTPTMISPATNYTITAYNSVGGKAALLNIAVNATPVPVISYAGPQTYIVGIAITALAPTGSGVAAAGFSGSPVTLGTGFSSPTSVAADAAGNMYVTDEGHKLVKKIPVGGGAPVTLGSGFVTPYGVAVDAAGNVYVADYGNNSVKEIPVGGGALVTMGSGFLTPTDVAVDAAGNIYVADYGNGAVKKIPVGGGAPITLGSGFSHPAGVAVDGLGNVYLADPGNNTVKKIPVGSNTPVILGSGFITPHGVAVDGTGNVFVADYGNNAIKEIPVGGGAPVIIGAGFSHPVGVAVDAADNVYAADFSNNAVKQIKPAGGYYISGSLPAGLSFANATGTISGTPTVVSPAANYTITAYNSFGGKAATLSITINPLPVPVISYSSPQTYAPGTAITPLAPTSSGVAAAGYNAGPVILGSGFSSPTSVAVDVAGNVYAADEGHKLVKMIPVGGGAPVTLGSGFSLPYGVTADGAGNVYVADYSGNAVKEIPAGNGTPITLGSGFLTPTGVAVDAAGNVYVADFGNNAVKKIPFGGGAPVALGSGFSHPSGVAVDGLGNVFVADYGNNAIKKIPMGGGAPVILGSGFVAPRGVAVDGTGNVFVADYGNSAIKEIPQGSGAPVTLGTGFSHPVGIAVDIAGNVYAADYGNNAVKQIKPAGGYYINQTLPAGLSFSNATGTISGTPTASSPATNYMVYAWNSFGSNLASVNIRVSSNNASLSNLVLSNGSLNPAFATGTTNYTADMPVSIPVTSVWPTTSDPTATVMVNGITVASGTSSQLIILRVGPNPIVTVVTAANGYTTETYYIIVYQIAPPSMNTVYQQISVVKPTDSVSIENDGIKVHQGVSPNGDGINDVFTIDGLTNYPNNKVTIMNRNGAVIYEAKGYDNSSTVFDGHSSINGAMQLPGTYFYLLEYQVGGDTKRKTGFVILKY